MSSASLRPTEKLRIAVVSTPRSGNTWVRHLLGHAYDIPTLSRHSLSDDEWDALPDECVLQIHWRREPDFVARLERHGFRVLTVGRHPLDTLISILHVVVYDVESENWLSGRYGDETGIWGAWPRSRAFLNYCASPRAAELLAVTCDWWNQPGVVAVKYENFVRNTAEELAQLTPHFGPLRCASLDAVLEKTSLQHMRKTSTNNHFWMGKPGLWREFLPPAEAYEVGWSVKGVLDALDYALDPNPDLDPQTADQNWLARVGAELGQTLRKNTVGHRAQIEEAWAAVHRANDEAIHAYRERDEAWAAVAAANQQAVELVAAVEAARQERDTLQTQLAECQNELHDTTTRLAATESTLTDATTRATKLTAELHRTQAALADTELALTRTRHELADVTACLKTTEATAVNCRQELADTQARLAAVATEFATLQSEFTASRSALSEAQTLIQKLRAERDILRTNAAATEAELRDINERLLVASREWAAAQHDLLNTRSEVIDLRQAVAKAWDELAACRAELIATRGERNAARQQIESLITELNRFQGLQGFSIRLAWRLQRLRNRFPWTARIAKRLVTWQ
jgi:predicted  nucleic acid-binding Zn-ribbon protein